MMENSRTVIDVRSRMEYDLECAEGSINIPLQEIPNHLDEIRNMENPVLCCVSGSRSEQAVQFLRAQGIACENGGCWEFFCE